MSKHQQCLHRIPLKRLFKTAVKHSIWNSCWGWKTCCVPQSVAQAASCCQRSWRQFWTGLATSVSQRCARRSSSLQTSLSAPWGMHTNIFVLFFFSFFSLAFFPGCIEIFSILQTACSRTEQSLYSSFMPLMTGNSAYLVLTSSLHLLMMHESSKRMGNHPRTHTRSSGATFMSSLV